ncbi:MAG: hypothetical protein JW779_03075 [Candidatus Thorarchaeota archaeon]|nr:hypothetical protein [Candidatus Thorarchaeota archaeon]
MWLEIFLIPFVLALVLFIIFWIVHEGSRWQKHPQLGIFARIIQASPGRAFLIFLVLTIAFIPLGLLLMTGMWIDKIAIGITPEKSDVVNVMLLTFLVLAGAFAVMYGAYGTWRQASRAEAELKVRPSSA